MRVFVAGSTGAVGTRLVSHLIEGRHEVIALCRTSRKARELEARGARVAIADALNKEELTAAIVRAEPEVIIHQLTALTWLPALAAAVHARPPIELPAWLGRLLIGDGGVSMMTKVRGGSNAKAKRELGWQLSYPTWRRGFVEGLG